MSDYHAYLIRLWRDDIQQPWRAELVSPHSGEARRFPTTEQLFLFMQQQMEASGVQAASPDLPDRVV